MLVVCERHRAGWTERLEGRNVDVRLRKPRNAVFCDMADSDTGLGALNGGSQGWTAAWKSLESQKVAIGSVPSDAEKDGIAEQRQHSAHIVTVPKLRFTSLAPVLIRHLS